ncbi:MAG: N-acyl homoserine lactonase family protein [Chitinophagaceae bacterium]
MKKIILLLLILQLVSASSYSQSQEYKVYALKFAASSYDFSVGDWVPGGPATEKIRFTFFIWLIRGNNGRNVLVDAGFLPDAEDAKEFQIVEYQRPDSALAKLGLKATDITDIIISHPHWDHLDGISLFPNATAWMQKDDYKYFVSDAWQKDSNNTGFYKRDVLTIVDLNLQGKLKLVNGDNQEIIPGITVYTGSRHTYDSQYAVVQSGNKKIVLASDNIWLYYQLEQLAPPVQGGSFDPAGYVRAMERMKKLASETRLIIPGHDPRVFKLFPEVVPGVIEIR